MSPIKILSSQSSASYSADFISLSTQIAQFAAKADVTLVPFHSRSLPHFSPLPSSHKERILQQLISHISWLENAASAGTSFISNKQLLWHFVKSQDLVLCSDLMDKIGDDDVIEIHELKGLVQIFNSFSFYDKSSYTLEEIYSYPWQELYEVDPAVQQNIFNLAQDIVSGKIRTTYDPQFPNYVVRELKSVFKYKIHVQYHRVSPIFDRSGRPVAAVSVETLKVLNGQIPVAKKQQLIKEHFDLGTEMYPLD